MAYHSHDHHVAFLPKKETTSLNIAHAIVSFAEWLIGIYIPIYLWVEGTPLWLILIFHGLISVGVVVSALGLTNMLPRLSDKKLMSFAIPLRIIFYLAVPLVIHSWLAFFLLPLLLGVSLFLFNTGFNIDYAESTQEKTVGRTVGSRYALVSWVLLLAPLIGGVLITETGFNTVFLLADALLVAAVVLLFFYPSKSVSSNLTNKAVRAYITDKSLRPFNLSSIGYAGEKSIGLVLWALFTFLVIGSIERFGILVSVGLAVGIAVAYIVGHLTDSGRRQKSIWFVVPVHAALWFSRLFLVSPISVAASYAAGATSYRALLVPWESQYYLVARATHIPEAFVVSRELLYNATRIVLLGTLALCAWAISAGATFALGFILATLFSLLFLFANRAHRSNLDAFIKDGK